MVKYSCMTLETRKCVLHVYISVIYIFTTKIYFEQALGGG